MKSFSQVITGAYYEVYQGTSRVLAKETYELAMVHALQARDISVVSRDRYPIAYKDRLIGDQPLEVWLAEDMMIENKVVDRLTSLHKAQTISHLKSVAKPNGFLFNFGSPGPEFQQLEVQPLKKAPPLENVVSAPVNWLYPDLAYHIVGGLYEVHHFLGAGFRSRIYAHACQYELELRGLKIQIKQKIRSPHKMMSPLDLATLIVEDKVIVFPVAIGYMDELHLDYLKHWLAVNGCGLGILANFDAVGLEMVFIR